MNPADKPEVAQAGAQLLHPGSRILFRHWESVRAERPCPERNDMDLRAISKLMPALAVIEKDQTTNSPMFKLAGTAICDLFQRQMTGADVGLAMEHFERRVVDETLLRSLQTLQPCLIRLRFLSVEGTATTAEFLSLPVLNRSIGSYQLFSGIFSFAEQSNGKSNTLARIELVATRMIWTEHLIGEQFSGQPAPHHFRVIQGGMSQR